MNQLSTTKRAQIVRLLVEGNSISAVTRTLKVGKNTVARLLNDLGCACAEFHNRTVRDLPTKRVQCDEIWSFIGAKQKNVPKEKRGGEMGDCWTWTGIDADSKLMIGWLVGGRDAGWACEFMSDIASRLSNRVQLTTDGHQAYLTATASVFGGGVDYAMLVKKYGAERAGEARYSPAQCVGCESVPITGNPDADHISTSFVERTNLTLRMSTRRFTRLTNGYSKKLSHHKHAVTLFFTFYNFCRPHMSLDGRTPAMEAGLADHVWSVEELVGLLGD